MVTSDFRLEVEIQPFCACAMHNYRNSLFIVDVAMEQIPRSTERISHYRKNSNIICTIFTKNRGLVAGVRIIHVN